MSKTSGAVETALPRAALIVAHPPHILTLYGWMSRFKPLVHILTDGRSMDDPLAGELITQTLKTCGATPGEIFGQTSESLYFKALLERDLDFFVSVARTLAASLVRHDITVVVADAEEGDNSIHDICRAITDAAVDAARKVSEREIVSYACHQTEWIKADRPQPDPSWLEYPLEPDVFAEKLAVASRFTPWSNAIAEAVEGLGQESFRRERLAPVRDHARPVYAAPPFYEVYGEERVASGKYANVIRYQEHMAPVWEALREFANAPR